MAASLDKQLSSLLAGMSSTCHQSEGTFARTNLLNLRY